MKVVEKVVYLLYFETAGDVCADPCGDVCVFGLISYNIGCGGGPTGEKPVAPVAGLRTDVPLCIEAAAADPGCTHAWACGDHTACPAHEDAYDDCCHMIDESRSST